ncbi:uncharacterized protein MKZ38_008076 [Zalerion maritima]|uniref:Zn(2)-C6 fungal-type domain-containing protein n=1 Tax=Zalerion maritima TaxID=339359 RepID=A0AAD5WPC5_9PEZI|nr:uncharacterized protein MKZ38_008076 [Zalerion maritima]
MASVASGQSPHSGYDLHSSNSEDAESWQFIEDLASNPSFYSPETGSLQSYAVIGPNPSHQHTTQSQHQQQPLSSPPAVSPLLLNENIPNYSSASFPEHTTISHGFADASIVSTAGGNTHIMAQSDMASFMDAGNMLFTDQQIGLTAQEMSNFSPFDTFNPGTSMPVMDQMNLPGETVPGENILDLGLAQNFQTSNPPPWNPTGSRVEDGSNFIMDNFQMAPPPQPQPSPSLDGSSSLGRSPSVPKSPASIVTSGGSSSESKSSIRKTTKSKITKNRKRPEVSPTAVEAVNRFVVVTPTTISAHAGKPNPFECFEAMRATQRGRKGPLAEKDKEFALQVRRKGACFCCHARKVKCDTNRPCKNCKKLTAQVPGIVCWQFPDFLPVLFPEFVRGHFRKSEMERFVGENIEGWTIAGTERPVMVELSSGKHFSATLKVKGKFFTARTPDVLQHWHVNVRGNEMDVQSMGSVPIGINAEGGMRDTLKKSLKEYMSAIISEPYYAEQTTDSFRHTLLPQRLLRIIHGFNQSAEAPVVRKALGIYAMHYVLSRHLTITDASLSGLQHTGLVPRNVPWVTPRVLNRQIKSVVDELLLREMQLIFEMLGKLLKPKTRREWAPCLAAFLVLCLFMEEVETAADRFVISQNEINLRNHAQREYKRGFALGINREVEKLPFRQVAYQFHQIYQTHLKDGATGLGQNGGKAFNPLVDDSAMEELDGPAVEMVMRLREVITGESWAELDFLSMDPLLPNEEDHPYPRDVAYNYTGRLVSKFLLSFQNENYILDGNI